MLTQTGILALKTDRSKDHNIHFSQEIRALCNIDVMRCIQCQGCTSVCPFSESMDLPPNKIMRMIQYNLRDQVLSSSSIWLCVGCHTCSNQCPQAIDIVTIMDTLRSIAIDEQRPVPEPLILAFHRSVMHSIEGHGRTHKLEIMLRYKSKTGKWFEDMNLGLKMLSKRKLDLAPSTVSNSKEIKEIFSRTWEL